MEGAILPEESPGHLRDFTRERKGLQQTLPKTLLEQSLNTTLKDKSNPTENKENNNTILLLASGCYCGRL